MLNNFDEFMVGIELASLYSFGIESKYLFYRLLDFVHHMFRLELSFLSTNSTHFQVTLDYVEHFQINIVSFMLAKIPLYGFPSDLV